MEILNYLLREVGFKQDEKDAAMTKVINYKGFAYETYPYIDRDLRTGGIKDDTEIAFSIDTKEFKAVPVLAIPAEMLIHMSRDHFEDLFEQALEREKEKGEVPKTQAYKVHIATKEHNGDWTIQYSSPERNYTDVKRGWKTGYTLEHKSHPDHHGIFPTMEEAEFCTRYWSKRLPFGNAKILIEEVEV